MYCDVTFRLGSLKFKDEEKDHKEKGWSILIKIIEYKILLIKTFKRQNFDSSKTVRRRKIGFDTNC